MAEMLKKLSPKTIMGEKIEAPEENTLLYTIFGVAKGVRSGESMYGPWTSLVGTFEVIRASDQKVFQGAQCFVPEPFQSMIAENLRSGEVDSVEFSIHVILKPRPDLPVQYEYIGEQIADVQTADPLAALRKLAVPSLEKKLALAAPDGEGEEEEPEPEPEPTPAKKSARAGKKTATAS